MKLKVLLESGDEIEFYEDVIYVAVTSDEDERLTVMETYEDLREPVLVAVIQKGERLLIEKEGTDDTD